MQTDRRGDVLGQPPGSLAQHRLQQHPGRPPRDRDDAELLSGCRAGERDAWDELVRRYERLVYSVALRNGLGPHDATDVCQTTFVALLESIARLRSEDRLASWLMTVARRQAWRVRRQHGQEQLLSVLPEQVDDPLGEWEVVAGLHDALSQLAEPCRSLLIALYFEPQTPSYAEVAQRFGRSVGGIGPMRGRCLERMRALMTQDEHP